MRNTINRRTKIGLVAGILFCLILAISTFSVTTFAFAQESSVHYLDKITVHSDDGQIAFKDAGGLKSAMNSLKNRTESSEDETERLSDKNDIEVMVAFDFDYKQTAEYKSFLTERDSLVTQADVDNFRQRLSGHGDGGHGDGHGWSRGRWY